MFIGSLDSTTTLENLTDIFQSVAINAEFVLLIKFKIIKLGFL